MDQVERVRKHPSNLITGIAAVGGLIRRGCFREKLADYSSENTLLRLAVPRNQRLAGSAGCSDWCAICFRRQRSEGNNFEIKGGIKNPTFRNFGFWLTTTSKVGRRCWTTGIIASERSNEG